MRGKTVFNFVCWTMSPHLLESFQDPKISVKAERLFRVISSLIQIKSQPEDINYNEVTYAHAHDVLGTCTSTSFPFGSFLICCWVVVNDNCFDDDGWDGFISKTFPGADFLKSELET